MIPDETKNKDINKTIREIIDWCDEKGHSDQETLELIRRVVGAKPHKLSESNKLKEDTTAVVSIKWDPEADVWIAVCDRIGLALESGSYDALIERVKIAAPEMIEENKIKGINTLEFKTADRILIVKDKLKGEIYLESLYEKPIEEIGPWETVMVDTGEPVGREAGAEKSAKRIAAEKRLVSEVSAAEESIDKGNFITLEELRDELDI